MKKGKTMKKLIIIIEDTFRDYEKIKGFIDHHEFDVYPDIEKTDIDEGQKKLNMELFGVEDIPSKGNFKKEVNKLKQKLYSIIIEKNISNRISLIILDMYLLPADGEPGSIDIEQTTGFGILRYIREIEERSLNLTVWGKFVPIFILTEAGANVENIKETINRNINYSANEFNNKRDLFEGSNEIKKLFQSKLKYWSAYFLSILEIIDKNAKPNFDIAIISAFEEEMEPFRNFLDEESKISELGAIVLKNYNIKNVNNKEISIITAVQKKMGMFDASFLILNILLNYNVQHIFMIGVCGGNKADVNIGDIIIPNTVKLFSKGKITHSIIEPDIDTANNNSNFYSSVSSSSTQILRKIIDEIKQEENEIFTKFKENIKKRDVTKQKIELHNKIMGCSDYVIDRTGLLKSLKELAGARKLISVDTESFPVIKFGERSVTIKTDVIKSVMDLTENKNDKYKEVAAYISARFLYEILVQGIYPID